MVPVPASGGFGRGQGDCPSLQEKFSHFPQQTRKKKRVYTTSDSLIKWLLPKIAPLLRKIAHPLKNLISATGRERTKSLFIDFSARPVNVVSFLKPGNILLIIYTRDFKPIRFRDSVWMYQSAGSVGLRLLHSDLVLE
jgi:hypothetical protein